MTFHPTNLFQQSTGRRLLLLLVALTWIETTFHPETVTAQLPGPTEILENTDPPKVEQVRPISEWIEGVKKRLASAESLVAKAKQANEEPASALLQQVELLGRLELSLGQVALAEADAESAAAKRDEMHSDLDEFLLQGLPESESSSFLLLDETRDQLDEAKNRLKRLKDREKAALQELENARNEFKELESTRRTAKDSLDESDADAKRIPLNQKLAVATLAAEVAEATVRRREAELMSVRLSREAQAFHLKQLEEKVQLLNDNARFDQVELNAQLAKLAEQANELKNSLAEMKGNDTRRKYLEEQWMSTQRQLDASTGDKSMLQEELHAYHLGRSNLDKREEILKTALDRLVDSQEIWKRRHQIISQRPAKSLLSEWEDDNEQALSQLRSEQRIAKGDLEDFRNQLLATKVKLDKAAENSPEANWYAQQATALQGMIQSQELNLDSIQSALQLNAKMQRQLSSDSLTENARQKLAEFWETVEGIWNTEITSSESGRVTVEKVVKALLLFFVGFVFARIISRWLGRHLLGRMDIDASGAATVQSLSFYLLLVLFSLLALNVVRVPLTAFTVLGGAVALGIGFGSQNIVNNFISGLILHAERPVKIGDLIQIGELYGNVEHIGARSTRIRTGDNLEIIVPNSKFLQDNVVNFTLSSDKMRTHVTVGVAYGSPVVEVAQLLKRAVVGTGRASKEPPPIVLFKNFGDNSLEFEVHFWIRMRTMMDRRQIESAVRYQVAQLFAEEGITVAFPQRDVHLNTNSPLVVQMADSDHNLTQGPDAL
ncbi:mechanosensitive ion channel domain-containing protein [Bythopirellula goksoeyrii]|uniref:Mechanosensitive channel MscK n=1 Tax=Bythopirellula goksoeyrii TaxID=1400387 RepID=A0A5B9QEK4_9BACT|nr:mechanosensitive ion channel domain-containing protein [Bythopirellula goksoeyrii]QEG35336.1 Mechanosensitive channel MscK precursor [Bythopirellula goksoeyrii]